MKSFRNLKKAASSIFRPLNAGPDFAVTSPVRLDFPLDEKNRATLYAPVILAPDMEPGKKDRYLISVQNPHPRTTYPNNWTQAVLGQNLPYLDALEELARLEANTARLHGEKSFATYIRRIAPDQPDYHISRTLLRLEKDGKIDIDRLSSKFELLDARKLARIRRNPQV